MKPRRGAIAFRVVTAPAFACCFSCRAALVGTRAWQWRERDGSYGYGCRVHLFPAQQITAAHEAA